MQEWHEDFYDNDGCCLTCEDKEEGCLCFSCKCRQCYQYSDIGGVGVCDITQESKERWNDITQESKERWKDIKERMKDDGRELLFCSSCKTQRFMKIFDNDDIADFYCFSCHNYFTKEFLRMR